MKKKFNFYDLAFQKRFSGLLILLHECVNSLDKLFYGSMPKANSEGGLLCVSLNVNSPAANVWHHVKSAAFSTG
ncbi:hypothetical protein EV144_101696 [Flavobacterium sp. 270]|uniref:hypothetical protein n=1 Tax=Flavobacterium sp. 270 TaxID=2512114 RepID=UPI001065B1EB|nr:hypothetical protein [Flavobacterium sp. 270]TDW52016.1 hypothetical protein EV144_101696 [Flavobacterium sp. 270]